MLLQRQVARTFGADAVDLLLRYQVRTASPFKCWVCSSHCWGWQLRLSRPLPLTLSIGDRDHCARI